MKSYSGLFLSLFVVIFAIIYMILEGVYYKTKFTVSYSQHFVEENDKKDQKINFGFRLDQKWKEAIAIKLYDSYNNILDDSKVKFCDENLNEIKNGFPHDNNN